MEDLTVVIFFVEQNVCAKRLFRREWHCHVEREKKRFGATSVEQWKVYLPGWYRKKKLWEREQLAAYMEKLALPREDGRTVWLLTKEAEELLDRRGEPLSTEWLHFLMDYYRISFDAIVLMEDRELNPEEWVMRYVAQTRYIGILSSRVEQYEDLQEELLEEYGFLLEVADQIRGLCIPAGMRTLIIAAKELYNTPPLLIPRKSVWLSAAVGDAGARKLCARGRETKYLDLHGFLRKEFANG